VAEVCDEATARGIQLMIEYDPAPPFEGGTPRTSPSAIVDKIVGASAPRQGERAELVEAARANLVSQGRL
nr:DJ-1/PfpI family protein [Gammaproteobacteria bacterium]